MIGSRIKGFCPEFGDECDEERWCLVMMAMGETDGGEWLRNGLLGEVMDILRAKGNSGCETGSKSGDRLGELRRGEGEPLLSGGSGCSRGRKDGEVGFVERDAGRMAGEKAGVTNGETGAMGKRGRLGSGAERWPLP